MVRLGPHRLWGYSFDAKLEYLSSSVFMPIADRVQKMALPHTMDYDQRN